MARRGNKRAGSVAATASEIRAAMPGDDLVPQPDSVMDRAFTVPAAPPDVWPWIIQLGKKRAGWYLPRTLERFIPRARRAVRHIDPRWQNLKVGDIIPDYGGPNETFRVAALAVPGSVVYESQRRQMLVSWSITLTPESHDRTRIHLRLRLGPVRRKWLVNTGGEFLDWLTIAGMAAGLTERIRDQS